jgi:hypothetical protein
VKFPVKADFKAVLLEAFAEWRTAAPSDEAHKEFLRGHEDDIMAASQQMATCMAPEGHLLITIDPVALAGLYAKACRFHGKQPS